jgi:hypothetical protein
MNAQFLTVSFFTFNLPSLTVRLLSAVFLDLLTIYNAPYPARWKLFVRFAEREKLTAILRFTSPPWYVVSIGPLISDLLGGSRV